MFLTVFRVVLLLLCFCGYFLMLRKAGLPIAFAPVVTVSSIGSILFVAGILNLLPHATLALFAGGLYCLFRCRTRTLSGTSRADWLQLAGFGVLCAVFCLMNAKQYPLHYDAFSHWMTVIHDTLNNDRFPNFASTLISFQGYPTGGAGLAYFICKIIGLRSDNVILMTQALPVAAGLFVFVGFIKRFDLYAVLLTVIGALYCIVASPTENLSICEPLPDTQISMLSVAALAVIVFYRKQPSKALWWSLPMQIFLAAVKNSGVFMLVFNTILLVFYFRRSEPGLPIKKHIKPVLIHCGIPFGVFFLWDRHVDLVFQYGTLTKHSLSLDYYRGTLGGKTIQQVLDTILLFLKRFFGPNPSWLLLVVCLLLFGGIFFCSRRRNKDALMTLLGIVGTYVLYMVGLAAMYLMSMSVEESSFLAGYDRYEETVLIYLVAAMVIYLLETSEAVPGKLWRAACVLLMGVTLLTQTSRLPMLFRDAQPYEGSSRQMLEQLKEAYAIPDGASCLIYGQPVSADLGYHDGLGRYVFWSADVRTCAPGDGTFSALAAECDYLVLLSTDENTDRFLTENGLTPGEAVYLLQSAE